MSMRRSRRRDAKTKTGSKEGRLVSEHSFPFGKRRTVHDLDLMLLPAGHIFGSAQLCLFTAGDTLLYTGDFKLRPGKSAEQAQWQQADTLIMETTFGLPRYRFPPTEQ